MAEREPRGDDENCDGPDEELKSGPSQDGQHWYSWSIWKYIGGGLFLLLSVAGVGYVVWDIIDLLPKPIAMGMVREALREPPGRITDMVAVVGLISFGPPAGVDLMFGATEAARQWARERQKKERVKGRAEGQEAERKETRDRLKSLIAHNPQAKGLQEWLDELTDD